MRALVVGGGGMLGHQLYRSLGPHVETHATFRRFDDRLRNLGWFDEQRVHAGIDALDEHDVAQVLRAVRPDWVINCVGIIKQLAEAKDPERCLAVNAMLPHRLARQCEDVGARLIQISTDCVFSGTRGNYTEADVSDATDLYGRSKYLGEVVSHGAITLRTSIVGTALADDVSLFDWFLSRGDTTVKGFTQAIYTGLTTERLADEVVALLERPPASGLWQVSSEKITKYELLLRLKDAFGVATRVIPDHDFKCDRSLSSAKYQADRGYLPPTWDAMIERYVKTRTTSYGWKSS